VGTLGCGAGVLNSTLSALVALTVGVESDGGGFNDVSDRTDTVDGALFSWLATSPKGRSDALSALGPVGGAAARPVGGRLALGAAGAMRFEVAGTALGATGVDGIAAAGLDARGGAGAGGGAGAVLDFTSSAGFFQTLDPKAGTAAGGDEGRGAYLSLEASARLASKASSFPGSLRSLADDGSTASEGRREYESNCGPERSNGDA
jgi:hypothetical protein